MVCNWNLPPLSVLVKVDNCELRNTLLFPLGLRSCLPNVVEAVDEDEFEDDELFAVIDFPFLLLRAEVFEFVLEDVESLAFGIIILRLSTSWVE